MESEEWEKDEMGSLFEGMVLVDPSQMAAGGHDRDDDSDPSQMAADDEHDRDDQQQHQSLLPPPTIASTSSSSSSSVSQPLDENLFSDLTLITPVQTLGGIEPQSDPFPPPPTTAATTTTSTLSTSTIASREVLSPSISRQISTRKKKRAGLRIGYGRDVQMQIPDDHSHCVGSELPRLSAQPSSSSSVAEIRLGRAAAQEEEEEEEAFSSSCFIPGSCAENGVSAKNSEGIDSSDTTSVGAGIYHVDNSVPDAEPVALSEDFPPEGDDKQVNNSSSSSIELRLEQIRVQISEKLKHAREVVASVSATRKDSIRRRRKAAENLSQASTKYMEMEKALEEACEAEDFETAERVSESLASAETEKQLLTIALRDAEMDCDSVDFKMHEALELQIAVEEDCASLLESFAVDAANNADLVLKNAEVMSSKEMDEWISSTEGLEVKKMEFEIESHLINEARLVLNDSIECSVEDDRREREVLSKEKERLTEELEKLLGLVKQKEAEIAENDSKIDKVEKRIADVISGFQEVQSSINMKYNSLQSCLSQMGLDNESGSREKKDIDDFLSREEGRGTKIRELARISADEANVYQEVVGLRKSLMQFILKSREDKVRLAKTQEKLSEEVQMLRQEVSAARASLQELSSTKSNIQQEIESFKQRLLFIDKRVPELEAEKKVAATARNFKEAARIATEAKTLCVEKEGVLIKMEGAMLELQKLEEEIVNTVNRLLEIEVQISFKEKELAMARFQKLLLTAGAATAERSAALELGDLGEADVLLAEAEAADSEARKLQPVYNFKEEMANLPKHFISVELVSSLSGKQLAELAASAHISAF